ncbi:VOC family protein [Pedobacter duraquae]|uniref:PhnB protein n=1 Tax=Pedobacter duraquae TaxID=425511 RepID=A0A4R6ILL7_9SPHI|nr:VOC family protein [Pedobacter duraquae]TDO22835.1 PhnB protein [Pedobacter duraquae]
MAKFNFYLNFKENTEEAFNFYKSVFGGEFETLQRFGDTPHAGDVPAEHHDKIMHVSLPLPGGGVLMGTDDLGVMGRPFILGNNISLSIGADSEAEADQLFGGLSEGATITMPLQKTFWGAYFGMLTDRFGIQWMVNYDYPQA